MAKDKDSGGKVIVPTKDSPTPIPVRKNDDFIKVTVPEPVRDTLPPPQDKK